MAATDPGLLDEATAEADATAEERFAPGEEGLRRRVARGTLVNAAFSIALTLLGLVKGFAAAAFISATDYGVWGLLFVSLATLLWLKQVGIGDKYIQQDETDQELAFQKAFTLELALTGLFTVLLCAVVPLLSLLTGQPELLAPGFLLVAAVPAISLQAPLWVYYRRMNFVRQRTLQAVDPIVGAVVTLALAIAGAGYWSLVVGLVAGSWAAAIVALAASPYRLALRYDPATLRSYGSFSWPLFVAAALSLTLPQGSVLIGEHAVGLAGVGAIALAVTVSQFARRVDDIVSGTLYPAICAVRDKPDLLFESFVKSNRLALMWGMPFGVAVALFAPDLVEFGLGERWEAAVGLIQVFGLIAAADQLGFNWDSYFRASGRTRPIAVVGAVNAAVFAGVTVPLMLGNGIDGYAAGMAILTAASIAGRAFFLRRMFVRLVFLRHAARAIAPVVPAAAAVLLMRLVEGDRTLAIAGAEVAAYLAIVAAATFALERPLIRELATYLRRPGGELAPA
jgi:PST family polysaccharide transporter